MSRKHINKLEKEVHIRRKEAAEKLLYAASAFAEQDLDSEVLSIYNQIRNSVQATLDDVETGILLWRTGKLKTEAQFHSLEKQEYAKVLEAMRNDKSENKEEVYRSLALGASACQVVLDKLLTIKQLGDLPHRNKKLNKLNRSLGTDLVKELSSVFICPLESCIVELDKFIAEEIE